MLEKPKLLQFDKMCKWFTAVLSRVKHVTGCMIIEKAMSFYDGMKTKTITHYLRAGCSI
jgi:hypothetical protein